MFVRISGAFWLLSYIVPDYILESIFGNANTGNITLYVAGGICLVISYVMSFSDFSK